MQAAFVKCIQMHNVLEHKAKQTQLGNPDLGLQKLKEQLYQLYFEAHEATRGVVAQRGTRECFSLKDSREEIVFCAFCIFAVACFYFA